MKKLDTSVIADGVGLPVKKGTLDFLQQSYKDLFAELAQELYPSLTLEDFPVALRGCNFSVDGSGVYTLQPGAIFIPASILSSFPGQGNTHTGEIFLLPDVQTTPSNVGGGDFPILTLSISYYSPTDGTADPVTFSDGNQHNVHQIRTLSLTHGVHGSVDNFVCYLDYYHPVTPPNIVANLLYGLQLTNYAVNSNFIKASTANAGASGNIPNSTSIFTAIDSFVASPTLNSNLMTVRFNCNLGIPGSMGWVYIQLVQNLKAGGSRVLRNANFGQVDKNVTPLDIVAYLETVTTYSAGDSFSVQMQANSYGSESASAEENVLICECFDAH